MRIPNSVEFGVYLCGCVSDPCRHRCQREIRLEGWVLSHMACGRVRCWLMQPLRAITVGEAVGSGDG
jgi:hypothetical protein